MKRTILLGISVLLGIGLVSCWPPAPDKSGTPATPPNVTASVTLSRAEFFSHTNDDNKDHDTGVYVYVKTRDGATVLAQVEGADGSGQDATEYNDHSDHTIPLLVQSPGSTKDDCRGFTVLVKQRTNGNDTWRFNARVTLYFSDGTNLVKSQDGISLSDDNAQRAF